MKSLFLRLLPVWTGVLCLAPLTAQAQSPKPAANPPKPPVHKPDQSALNRIKQDGRAKQQLGDAAEKLREAFKHNEAVDKELKRINSKDLKDDPAKVIESMKDKLSPEDSAALKEVLEKARKEALNSEDARKVIEEAKKKAAAAGASKPKSPLTPPEKFGPSTFDQVPAPVPAVVGPVVAKPRTPGFVATGDTIIFPPSSDPANPKHTLPPSDPRSRTYVILGSGQVKTPGIVLDADRIECIASQDNSGEGIGGLGKTPPKPKATLKGGVKTMDPVKPGSEPATAEEPKSEPFERLVATGRVNIVRIDKGKVITGKGGSLVYDKKSGKMILTDWPEVQDGKTVIVARQKDARIVLVPEGEPYSEGCQVLSMDEAKSADRGPKPGPAAPVPPRARPVP